ncbi:MAG: ketol-acid reductoisomerase [Bradymonadales bacterium]|nr:MAG: ketol-acid reductoisomerase [Bradymonadales bacterium]
MNPILTKEEIELLNSLSLGMFGFGAQGQAEARNLHQSQVQVKIAVRPKGASADRAKAQGFELLSFKEMANSFSHILMNLPDQIQGSYFKEYLEGAPQLKALIFSHGFASHFDQIPCKDAGPIHVLVAPKGAASGLVKLYGQAQALPAILAVKDASGERPPTVTEKQWIEALAKAMGAHPRKLIWARFQDEAVSDLFSEQSLLCGGLAELIRSAYEVLIENGYQPEAAYYETLYELKLIVDLVWEFGIHGMIERISPTARYGAVTRGDRVLPAAVKERMKEVLSEIESGEFAREFLRDSDSPQFLKKLDASAKHPIEKLHQEIQDKLKS